VKGDHLSEIEISMRFGFQLLFTLAPRQAYVSLAGSRNASFLFPKIGFEDKIWFVFVDKTLITHSAGGPDGTF
jgi:hypothetical protein